MLISRILLTVGLAAFAAAVVASGLDRVSLSAPGLERLVPAPFRAQADRSAALTAIGRKDNVQALSGARSAVASDPVDPDATPLLGSALLNVGRVADAQRVFRIAARFGWRNVMTQAFWYNGALQAGDYEVAADRLDALLRAHPQLVDRPELLRPLESVPAGRKVLAERLRLQPPWLGEYLNVDDDTPSDVIDRRLAILTQLNPSRTSIGCDTVAPFTRVLLQDGRRHDAEVLWNGICPTLKVAGLVTDPAFEHVLAQNSSKYPFSWRVMSSGDLSVREVGTSGGGEGLMLSNSASGTRLTLVQTVAFPEGAYRFRVHQAEIDRPAGGGKLYLSWACNGPPPFPAEPKGDLLGSGQIIQIGECDRQLIGLWLSGGGSSVALRYLDFQRIG